MCTSWSGLSFLWAVPLVLDWARVWPCNAHTCREESLVTAGTWEGAGGQAAESGDEEAQEYNDFYKGTDSLITGGRNSACSGHPGRSL